MNNDPMGRAGKGAPDDDQGGPLGRERSSLIGFLILIGALTFGVAVALDVGGLGAWFSRAVLGNAPARAAADGADAGLGAPQPFLAPIPAQTDAGSAPAASAAEITQAWFVDAAGYRGAEAERSATHAPMLIYFRKRACEVCHRVDRELLAAPELKSALTRFIKVRIDVTAGPNELRLGALLGVAGLPALVLVPPAGNARAVPIEHGGQMVSAAQLIASLRDPPREPGLAAPPRDGGP